MVADGWHLSCEVLPSDGGVQQAWWLTSATCRVRSWRRETGVVADECHLSCEVLSADGGGQQAWWLTGATCRVRSSLLMEEGNRRVADGCYL